MIPVTDPTKAEEVKQRTKHALAVAKALRIDYLFILFPHPPEDIPQSETWDLAVERYKTFA